MDPSPPLTPPPTTGDIHFSSSPSSRGFFPTSSHPIYLSVPSFGARFHGLHGPVYPPLRTHKYHALLWLPLPNLDLQSLLYPIRFQLTTHQGRLQAVDAQPTATTRAAQTSLTEHELSIWCTSGLMLARPRHLPLLQLTRFDKSRQAAVLRRAKHQTRTQ